MKIIKFTNNYLKKMNPKTLVQNVKACTKTPYGRSHLVEQGLVIPLAMPFYYGYKWNLVESLAMGKGLVDTIQVGSRVLVDNKYSRKILSKVVDFDPVGTTEAEFNSKNCPLNIFAYAKDIVKAWIKKNKK